MALGSKRSALELSTIIEIILLVLAVGIIIGGFSIAAGRADDVTSENLCRGFNALRFGTKIEKGGVSLNVAPRACKSIDKKDVPGKDYQSSNLKEGAQAQIRDLMARCWWMWLDGHQQNMFNARFYNLEDGCFICYTFSLDKKTGNIGYSDFSASLSTPYFAIDSSNKCASAGEGGICKSSCEDNEKETISGKCQGETKCCTKDTECENKGGKCGQDGPTADFPMHYPGWKCKSGPCYIKSGKMASYLDYIQGTNGVNGGAGKVLFGDNDNFKPGTKYAITFISPGNNWNLNTLAGGVITFGAGALTIAGVVSGVGTVPTLLLAGTTGASGYLTSNTGSPNDVNHIMVSKYETVKDKCAIETGAGEE